MIRQSIVILVGTLAILDLTAVAWSVDSLPVRARQAVAGRLAPQLRSSFILAPTPREPYAVANAFGGGLFVLARGEGGTSGSKLAFHIFDLRTHAWRVARPSLLGTTPFIGMMVVTHTWLAWTQSPDSQTGQAWQLCALNLRSGKEWLVDSAQAEGISPLAYQAGVGDQEIALGGDTLVWTLVRSQGYQQGRSLLKVANLATQATHVLVSIPITPRRPVSAMGLPTTDGRYIAWDRSTQATPATLTDTVELYDQETGRYRKVATHGQASEPAVGYGNLAWKLGPRFEDGLGIRILNLRTQRLDTITRRGAGRPTLGPCLLAYQDGSYGGDELYDTCTRQGIFLLPRQEKVPGSTSYYVGIRLAGDYATMGLLNPRSTYHGTAMFHLPVAHPLYDFYH